MKTITVVQTDVQTDTTHNVRTSNGSDPYSIGMYVLFHNRKHVICNRWMNGQLLISPMGNGDGIAKYYTVKEWDVIALNESVKVISDIVR